MEEDNNVEMNGIMDDNNSMNDDESDQHLSAPKEIIRKSSLPELSMSPTELEKKERKTTTDANDKSPELPATPNPSENESPEEQVLSEFMENYNEVGSPGDEVVSKFITTFKADDEPRTIESVAELLEGIIDDEGSVESNSDEYIPPEQQPTADDICINMMVEKVNLKPKIDLDKEIRRCQLSIMESKQTLSRCCELQEMLREASSVYPFMEQRSQTPPVRPWRRIPISKNDSIARHSSLQLSSPKFILTPDKSNNNKTVTFKKPLTTTQPGSLFDVVFLGDYDMTKSLVHQGHDVNDTDSYGKTPCHIASEQGHSKVLQLLLQNGAVINDTDFCGKTPLHYAVESGSVKAVDVLLSRSAFVNHADKSMKTPLHIACEKGQRAIVEMLLGCKATTLDDLDTSMKSPLHYAVENDHFPVVIHLVKAGAPVNQSDGEHRKPLHYAAAGGFIRIARFLVENGASVDPLDNNLQTPLFLAVTNGFKSVVNYLIFHGASVDISDSRRQTPLHMASAKGYTEIVNDLVSNNASLDPTDEEGRTPLHFAAQNQDVAMTTVLLKHGANPDTLKSDLPNRLADDNGLFSNNLAYLLEELGHKKFSELK